MQWTFRADYEGVICMPRYRPVVLAAVCALALAAPASAAYAATAHHAAKPVLTISKKGGPAVRKRAVLKASLPKGKSATFALNTSSGSFNATCTSSALKAKVTGNPARSGKATLSLTAETFGGCALTGASGTGITLTGIKALNLPYGVTISSAKGFPVAIVGRSRTKPLSLEASITVSSTTYTCVVTARRATAHASNSGNKVTVKEKLSLDATDSSGVCSEVGVSSATFSATYGPLRDTSVKHSPKVFFN
jgi:hypothetical protein